MNVKKEFWNINERNKKRMIKTLNLNKTQNKIEEPTNKNKKPLK